MIGYINIAFPRNFPSSCRGKMNTGRMNRAYAEKS